MGLEQLLKANDGILPLALLSDADTGLDAAGPRLLLR